MSQMSLFDDPTADESGLEDYADGVTRKTLTRGAWLDLRPSWVTRPDLLMADLLTDTPWQAERRQMYERVVDVPRLLNFLGPGEDWPPLLEQMRRQLSDHYRNELGEDFVTAGMCLYRDGRDSVAWHGDRVAREGGSKDTIVVIVSLGDTRRLGLRPRGGGQSLQIPMRSGDVAVMGGSCQRTWEHAILKTQTATQARISVQFRVAGVR